MSTKRTLSHLDKGDMSAAHSGPVSHDGQLGTDEGLAKFTDEASRMTLWELLRRLTTGRSSYSWKSGRHPESSASRPNGPDTELDMEADPAFTMSSADIQRQKNSLVERPSIDSFKSALGRQEYSTQDTVETEKATDVPVRNKGKEGADSHTGLPTSSFSRYRTRMEDATSDDEGPSRPTTTLTAMSTIDPKLDASSEPKSGKVKRRVRIADIFRPDGNSSAAKPPISRATIDSSASKASKARGTIPSSVPPQTDEAKDPGLSNPTLLDEDSDEEEEWLADIFSALMPSVNFRPPITTWHPRSRSSGLPPSRQVRSLFRAPSLFEDLTSDRQSRTQPSVTRQSSMQYDKSGSTIRWRDTVRITHALGSDMGDVVREINVEVPADRLSEVTQHTTNALQETVDNVLSAQLATALCTDGRSGNGGRRDGHFLSFLSVL